MIKCFLYISFSLLIFNLSFAQNTDIQEDIKISFVCELEKKILKNSEYNYQTFLAKDLENKTVELSRRDDFSKSIISIDSIDSQIPKVLDDIQQSLFLRANNFRLENTTEVNSFEEFKEVLKNKGGFISC